MNTEDFRWYNSGGPVSPGYQLSNSSTPDSPTVEGGVARAGSAHPECHRAPVVTGRGGEAAPVTTFHGAGEETAGATAGGGLPSAAPAVVRDGPAASARSPQPFPDLDSDLVAVCDCDTDGIVAGLVWRSLQPDVLLHAVTAVVRQCLWSAGIPPVTTRAVAIGDAVSHEAARAARLGIPPSNPVAVPPITKAAP